MNIKRIKEQYKPCYWLFIRNLDFDTVLIYGDSKVSLKSNIKNEDSEIFLCLDKNEEDFLIMYLEDAEGEIEVHEVHAGTFEITQFFSDEAIDELEERIQAELKESRDDDRISSLADSSYYSYYDHYLGVA